MTDVALIWNADAFAGDIDVADGAVVLDEGMRTAILLSLFTDARANDDDELPEPGGDRGGWWGDAFAEIDGDAIGSRLWLLRREKRLSAVLLRAREYCLEALQWLVRDRVASAIDVEVEAQGEDRLAIAISITRPNGPGRQRYDFTWEKSV